MSLKQKKIALIGVGNMGLSLMQGILESGSAEPQQLSITTRRPERARALAEEFGVTAIEDNADCAAGADVVLVAVKPQIFVRVLEEIEGSCENALVVSVAAGISTKRMEDALGDAARVIRAMPNTPATVKLAATALAPGRYATDADIVLATKIFEQIGIVVNVDESHLDAVTGLSGSGPAYIFLIIEAFADAGVKVGLSREVAMKLAVQTIRGSARLLQQTGEHPGRLKDQVTSPGGTAIAGLHTLEEGGLRTTIMNAVEAATKRARDLGKS